MSQLYRDILVGFKEIAELTSNNELKDAAEHYLCEESAKQEIVNVNTGGKYNENS